jgi:ATP-dependent protease ClpP protease subunit
LAIAVLGFVSVLLNFPVHALKHTQPAKNWINLEDGGTRVGVVQLSDRQIVTFYSHDGVADAMSSPSRIGPFLKFLRSKLSTKPVYFLVINGNGGVVQSHVDMMTALKRGGRRVTTIIFGLCASACPYWGSLADEGYLVAGTGQVQVHRGIRLENGRAVSVQSLDSVAQDFESFGASGRWVLNNPQYFPERQAIVRGGGVIENMKLIRLPASAAVNAGLIDGTIRFEELQNLLGSQVYGWLKGLF